MTFKFSSEHKSTSCTIIPLNSNDLTGNRIKKFLNEENIPTAALEGFKGKTGEFLALFGNKTKQIFLLGAGETPIQYKNVSYAFRKLSFQLKGKMPSKIDINFKISDIFKKENATRLGIEASIHGLILGTYDIGLYKTNSDKTKHPLSDSNSKINFITSFAESDLIQAAKTGKAKAETQVSIMDLVNAPGNKVIPSSLGEWATRSGKVNGFKTKVLSKDQIEKLGLDALLAVNRGSEYPPAFIIMEYKPKQKSKNLKTVGLVGKGVTFDTGGVSIKGSTNMHYMKSDMGGAAAVLGAMELTAKLQLPIHLIGIVPTTDNCVDATAIKPGDVINSYSGKTIEVINTDAEGRLILADGIAYMEKHFSPDIMIDLATLTGSSVRALGYKAAAMFTKNKEISEQLFEVGQQFGERVWQLPLWDDYHDDLHSDVADISNLGASPVAGAITAAKFLEFFTNEHPAWVHLDIAGVAFGGSEFSKQKSATGYGANLLVEYFKQLIK